MKPQIMIPMLFFLVTIAVLGTVLYVYLRKEQNKVISKDKYDEAWNEAFKRRNSHPTKRSSRFYQLFFTFGIALLITLFGTMISMGVAYGSSNFAWPILLIPISLVMFPAILTPLGYFLYPTIFLLGVFIENRKVFTFIYIAFIILLIINIAGCTISYPEFFRNLN